jgi:diguanylate cyclase (GGDEF)-like protein
VTVSRRTEVILGVVLPLVVLLALVVLGLNAGQAATWIAFMAAVPMFAAMFTRALLAGVVALATFLAAMVTAAVTYGQEFSDAIPVLVGVIIGAGAAVMASQMKAASAAPRREPAPRAAGSPGNAIPTRDTDTDTDDVTGLPTRAAARALLDGSASAGPRIVLIIGCDGMTALNDARGPEIGDVFLFAVAGRTRWALPDGDTVARWGGDEILAVIDGDLASTTPALQLIADKVNMNPIRTDEGLIPLTISLGAADWVVGGSFDDAVGRARRALHLAKAGGRGRLVLDGS